MALCLANSLIARRDFVPYDQLVRYKWWYRKGYMSSTGHCFDIGTATSDSLNEFQRRQKDFARKHNIPEEEMDYLSDRGLLDQFDVKCSRDDVAGNGALMRLAPVPLFFYKDPVTAVKYSGRSGLITHGDLKAYDACRYYGALIVAALLGESKQDLLAKDFYQKHRDWFENKRLSPEIEEIATGSYQRKGGYDDGIRGKGYIVNALEAALWAFWSDGDSFERGVCKAVNLGDDTDTTAAIYGQLAGAYYGYGKLPSHWREQVYAKEFIKCVSKWIVYEGENWYMKASASFSGGSFSSALKVQHIKESRSAGDFQKQRSGYEYLYDPATETDDFGGGYVGPLSATPSIDDDNGQVDHYGSGVYVNLPLGRTTDDAFRSYSGQNWYRFLETDPFYGK
jgi:ADP-ribosyl-[dinitrogen reductase] hydrolase